MTQSAPPGQPYHGQGDPYRDWGGENARPAPQRPQKGPRRRQRPKAQSRLLSYVLAFTVLLGLLIGAATAFLVFALPTSVVRNHIIAEVKRQTGRDLLIEGPSSFTLLPSVNVVLNNVTLLSPPGTGSTPTATVASLAVRVQPWPLLGRKVVIDKLVLREPVIDLRTDRNGRRSWQIAPPPPADQTAAGPEGAEDAPAEAAGTRARAATDTIRDFGAGKLARLDQLELGKLFIKNATLRYRDERSGARAELTAVDLRIGMTSLLGPVHVAGSLAWRGERLSVRGSLDSLRDLLEMRQSNLTFSLAGKPLSASYEGAATLKDGFALDGLLEAAAPSLADLTDWLGRKQPHAAGGALSVTGRMKTDRAVIELSDATLSLDESTARGHLSVDTSGARPYVKAELAIAEIDLGQGKAGAGETAATAVPPSAADTQVQPLVLPRSIEDLIQDTPAGKAPRVKGFKKRSGWSEKPLSLAALDVVDADARLSVGRLRTRGLEFGASVIDVALRDKVLKATFADAPFYEGRVRGSITLDARSETATVTSELSADGVAARALLGDAADVDWLAGTGKLDLALSGRGASERQIVDSLTGNASFHIAKGAFYGWNLTELLDGLRHGRFEALDKSDAAKTEFSELAGKFTIANGVAENHDLRLSSPQLQLTGTGKVLLGERRMDYVLLPKLVVTTGAQKSLVSIEVPVRVDGPWENPRFAPELPGGLGDSDKARDALRTVRKKLKGKSADEIVNELLGKGEGQDGEVKIKPKKLLQQLLKPDQAPQ